MHNCTQYLIDYLEAAFMAASSLVFWSACNRESSRTESHSGFRLLHLLGENSYIAVKATGNRDFAAVLLQPYGGNSYHRTTHRPSLRATSASRPGNPTPVKRALASRVGFVRQATPLFLLPSVAVCKGGSGLGLLLFRDHAKNSRSVSSTTRTATATMNPRQFSLPTIISAGWMPPGKFRVSAKI